MHKRSAFVITLIFGLTSVANIGAQIIIAHVLGISVELDAFLIAVTVPTMFIAVSYASINDTFLPLYSVAKTQDARTIAGSWIRTIALIGAVLCTLFFLFSKPILYALFSRIPEQSVLYLQVLSPAFFFGMLAALFMSISYSHKHFVWPPMVQLVGGITNVLLIWLLFPSIGGLALPIAFTANYVLQFLLVVRTIRFADLHSRFVPLSAIVPLVVLFGTYGLMRTDTLLLRLASVGLGTGIVSTVNYSARMMSMPAGLITSGIKVILLPLLAESLRNKNNGRFASLYTKGIVSSVFLTAVAVFSILILSLPLLKILFVRGAFTYENALSVNALIPWFIPAALGWGLFEIAAAPFIATKKYTPVALTTGISFVISMSIIFIFKQSLGVFTAPVAIGVLLGVNTLQLIALWQLKKNNYVSKK